MHIKLQMTFNELYERCIYSSIAHAVANLRFANSHFLRTAGPHFPDSPGHIKRTAWDISRAEGSPPY